MKPLNNIEDLEEKSNGEEDIILETDEIHLAITNLLYGKETNFGNYNDAQFVRKMRARALEGVKILLSKIISNCLRTEDTQTDFVIYEQLQQITLNSIKNNDALYVKTDFPENDVNVLEYALFTGAADLIVRFAEFGVTSQHLTELKGQLSTMSQLINDESAKKEIKWIVNALSSANFEKIQIIKSPGFTFKSRISNLLKNHKHGVYLQGAMFLIGLSLILVAACGLFPREPFGVVLGIGVALVPSSTMALINMLMNESGNDDRERIKLHKQQVQSIFDYVARLSISLNGQIRTIEMSNNIMAFRQEAMPAAIIEPIAKKNRTLIFSSSNLDGLHTNSETTSNEHRENQPGNLRRFSLSYV